MAINSEEIKSIIRNLPQYLKDQMILQIIEISNMKAGDPCWCLSERPFKSCHMQRSIGREITEKELRGNLNRIFDRKKYCCAAFDSKNCVLPIKGAHTVQRGKVLSSIAVDGHVGTFYRKLQSDRDDADKLKTGIAKQASIFYGFCSYHDTELFKSIEAVDFAPTSINCWASSYRAVCHEYYQKTAAQEAVSWMLDNADIGHETYEQLIIQHHLSSIRHDLKKGLQDGALMKASFEQIHAAKTYGDLMSYVITLDQPLEIATCASISPFYNIDGVRIQNFGDPAEALQHIAISTTIYNGMACYVVSHLKRHKVAEEYVASIFSKGNGFVKDWLFKSIFAYSENNYFNLSWWDGLSSDKRKEIHDLAISENYTRKIAVDGLVGDEVSGNVVSIDYIV